MKNTFYSQGNPYNIVRVTGNTHTASVDELIIADETEITLPSGVPAGSVIAVRSSGPDVTTDVVGASDSVDGFSQGTTHQEAKTGEYVYDGSDWYLRNSVDVRNGAIPDSAAYRWTHSEGSGTALGDSIDNNDGTISNPTWVQDSTAQGGYKLSFDDTAPSEYVDFAKVPEVGESSDFAVGITVELDTTSDVGLIWMHARSQSDDYIVLGLSNDDLNGEITTFSNGSNYQIARTLGADTTTNRMRLLINYSLSDDNNRTIRIYKNTSNVDSSTSTTENRLNKDSGHRVGTRQDDRSDARFGGDIDDLIIYNDTLTSSQIQADYDLQPWS